MKTYLTEVQLLTIIESYGYTCIHNKKFLKYRPDIRIDSLRLIIEFDGYLHYTNSNTCVKDVQKDLDYTSAGYRVVRIPYFIQWCKELELIIFDVNHHDVRLQTYPHGFIDSKATLPADYCWLGIQRFQNDLNVFSFAKNEIILSLKKNTKPINTVVPKPLEYLLDC